jgi:hypothetical protein
MSDPKARSPEPDDLFVEYLVRTRTTWGTRLHRDGRVEEWTDASGWQPLVSVPSADVEAFAGLVRRSGFFELPATIPADGLVADGTLLSWAITLDGRRHDVTAREASSSRNPVLRELDAELQRIVGEALNREADAGS